MFSEREAKLVGTSDFVVTRGYVQIRVVGFPYLPPAIGCRKMCAAFCGEMSDARDENRPFPLRISFFAACGRFWVDYEVST